jgi:hypothetical protein
MERYGEVVKRAVIVNDGQSGLKPLTGPTREFFYFI